MTDKEFFLQTIKAEAPKFENVLKALPTDKLDYKPDAKSRSAMELAGTIAAEAAMFPVFLKAGMIDLSAESVPSKTIDEAVAKMAQAFAEM